MSEPPTETEHIKGVGQGLYATAYAHAMLEIRQDRRLVGLDKLRRTIAHEAALRATGFPLRPLKLPRSAGRGEWDIQRIAEEVLDRAIVAAREQGKSGDA